MKNLKGKVVVITGAGSGIGRALSLNLARRGALLALSDVNESGLAETAEKARAADAADVHTALLDVADREAFAVYRDSVIEHFDGVNVIINNAGVALSGRVQDLDWQDIDWILGINLGGVINGTKLFLPAIIESGDGHIVNISSLFGLLAMPDQSFYNASKFAVRGFTEALREEILIDKHRVGITTVHPGGIKTSVARSARYSSKVDGKETAAMFDAKLARMSPEKAADIIVRAIEKDKARVLVGADAHLLHNFQKYTGSRYQDIVATVAQKIMPQPEK